MGRQSKAVADIPTIYKVTTLNLLLYGYLKGLRQADPEISIARAGDCFRVEFGIGEEDLSDEVINATFGRLQREFFNFKKSSV